MDCWKRILFRAQGSPILTGWVEGEKALCKKQGNAKGDIMEIENLENPGSVGPEAYSIINTN